MPKDTNIAPSTEGGSPEEIAHQGENGLRAYPLKQLKDDQLSIEIAECMLLLQDLQSSMDAIRIWHARYAGEESSSEDRIIGMSLFRDAVVQFVGCFDKSAKFSLKPEDVYRKENGGRNYFQWLQDIRDAYAAHKFGALRQMVVGVLVDPDKGVIGVGNIGGIYTGPIKTAGPEMLAFMSVAKKYLEAKIQSLTEKLLQSTQSMSLEQLNSLGTAKTYGVDPQEVRLSRPAFQRVRVTKPST